MLVAYAMDAVSFILQSLDKKELSAVRSVVLFGSAARGTASRKSDIDIFIDTDKEGSIPDYRISDIISRFFESAAYRKHWLLLGVKNNISCTSGMLDKWELRDSVIADGIVLYGKYAGTLRGKSYVLFYWDSIKPESKRVKLSKKLYGFAAGGKRYYGIVQKTGSTKIGSNCIMAPLEKAVQLKAAFRSTGVAVKSLHVSSGE